VTRVAVWESYSTGFGRGGADNKTGANPDANRDNKMKTGAGRRRKIIKKRFDGGGGKSKSQNAESRKQKAEAQKQKPKKQTPESLKPV
jgi:hypothetical protein